MSSQLSFFTFWPMTYHHRRPGPDKFNIRIKELSFHLFQIFQILCALPVRWSQSVNIFCVSPSLPLTGWTEHKLKRGPSEGFEWRRAVSVSIFVAAREPTVVRRRSRLLLNRAPRRRVSRKHPKKKEEGVLCRPKSPEARRGSVYNLLHFIYFLFDLFSRGGRRNFKKKTRTCLCKTTQQSCSLDERGNNRRKQR